ncbi:hypothetical protein D9Q98_005689 [Chlorella vulgaris]|uniref:Saposin B-type domain-containing protein n=1 Tax=Chlorella vulgaris TaxID=3077 RepID=A0A9D4TME9_CHLVU|nr:hypothetical protein D9Q98_005689 [Chlorella vulgaris]
MPRLLFGFLLLLATSCVAQQPAKKAQPAAGLLSLQGVKKAISHFFDGKKGLLCADCIQLAMEVDHLLDKPPDVASDDPNIATPGPGRRMKLHSKEGEILNALDAACDRLGTSKGWGEDVLQDCQRLVAEHRQALESSIFDKGTRALADTMCVSLFQLCNQHHLVDSGEL